MASSDASVSKEDAPKKTRIISEEEREKIDERRQVTDFLLEFLNWSVVIKIISSLGS